MKNLILITIIAILSISSCQGTVVGSDYCDDNTTQNLQLVIVPGTTKLLSSGNDIIVTWDDVITCLNNINSDSLQSIDIYLDSDVTVNDGLSLQFDVSNQKITQGLPLSITLTSNCGISHGDIKPKLYDILNTMYSDSNNKQLQVTIHSDVLITKEELAIIQANTGTNKIQSDSTFEIGKDTKCPISDLDNCLAQISADEAAVTDCSPALHLYDEVILKSTLANEMQNCLTQFNISDSLITKLTIDLSNASPAPQSSQINFNSILSDTKANITDLTVILSDSQNTEFPVVFAVNNLTIDYSNNGLDNSASILILDHFLSTSAPLATNNFEIIFSKQNDTTPNVLEDANKFVEYGNLSSTKIVKASDGTKDCTINSNNVNDNDCDFVVVQPTVNDAILEQCTGVTVSFDSDLDSTLDGSALDWELTVGNIGTWTDLENKVKLTDLPVAQTNLQTYTMSVSGPVSKNSKVIPVVYETVDFTINECNPSTNFIVGTEEIVKSYNFCYLNSDFVFGINETLTNNEGSISITENTTYNWNIQQKGQNEVLTDVTVAGAKNEKTFTVAGSEFTQGSTYVLSLTVGNPLVIVDNFEFSLTDCDATTNILVNGAALSTTAYDDCQDLVISLDTIDDAEIIDGTTTFIWKFLDSDGNSSLGTIDATQSSLTIPKDSLVAGVYDVEIAIANPTITVEDVQVTIVVDAECTNDDDDDDDDDNGGDNNASILQLGLVLYLILTFII